MNAEQLIQNAADTAKRLYPDDPEERLRCECEMLRRYLRELAGRIEGDAMASPML